MAFEPKTWANGSEGGTPVTAEELNRIEQGIANIELQEGPRGPKGAKGDPGEDGFPTEAQWNDLVARVEALEAGGEA